MQTAPPHAQVYLARGKTLGGSSCTNATLYLPEGLVRCARLIRRRDAREANALVQVAQRWLHHALQRLPPGAEKGFTRHVVVNRLLLDGDDQAVYLQPLR